jgi:hypothetical protein
LCASDRKRLMCPESDHLNLWFKMRAQRHLRGTYWYFVA